MVGESIQLALVAVALRFYFEVNLPDHSQALFTLGVQLGFRCGRTKPQSLYRLAMT